MKKLLLVFSLIFTATSFASQTSLTECSEAECVDYFNQYKKYAEKGYADALAGVGQMYYHGYGTEKNVEKAIKSLNSASIYGSGSASFNLGKIYLTDSKLFNLDSAIRYLRFGSNRKHVQATILLALVYLDPVFGRIDHEESDKWLARAYKLSPRLTSKYLVNVYNSNIFNEDKFERIPEVIENNEYVEVIEQPKGTGQKPKIKFNWPTNDDNDMEVITVSAPSLEVVMDEEIVRLSNNPRPEKFRTCGASRIRGRPCNNNPFVYEADPKIFKDMTGAPKKKAVTD